MGRKILRNRGLTAGLLVAALVAAGFAGLAPSASAAPNDFTATLQDTTHVQESGASGTAQCDATTRVFSGHVSNLAFWGEFPSGAMARVTLPDGGSFPIGPLTTPDFDWGPFTAISAAACAAGGVVQVSGPDDATSGLAMTGTLQGSAPPPPPPGDTTPPVVRVPANRTVEATGPTGATVTYSGVSANDAVDGPLPTACTRASGSVFPLGTTTITCRATDAAGNVGSASFTVRVVDTTAPQLTVPANIVVKPTALGRGGASNAPVTYAATATDIVSGNIIPSCTPPPGLFPFATTTVTCVATDRAGNRSATKTFTVTVRAPGATDDSVTFKRPTVGAVQGTVALAVSRTPPPVPLGSDTTVFACDTSITRINNVSTNPSGGQAPPCVKSETTDGSHTYAIGDLTPGNFNLFAKASSDAGDFTAGPVAVTIAAGTITTRDITVAVPMNSSGVTGGVTVTNIPTGAKYAFTRVFACTGPTPFAADGTPNTQRSGGVSCVEGHMAPAPPPATAKSAATIDAGTYEVGPVVAPKTTLYFVYSSTFGNIASPADNVSVSNGRITVAPAFTFALATQGTGSVNGHVALASSRTAPAVPLGSDVKVYACLPSVTTLNLAASSTRTGSAGSSTPPACSEGGSTDASHYYVIGQLKSGATNLFATVTSDAGNFTAGPVSVTIVGGQLITKDITVTFARNEGGLTGSVSADKVPPGIQFKFVAVYACDGTTQFTPGGTPSVNNSGPRTANACVEGHLSATTTTLAHGTETHAATFTVGPRGPGARSVYVVYSSAFGTAVSNAKSASVPNGGIGTVTPILITWPTQPDGFVEGHITITGAPTGPPGTEGAVATGAVTGYACSASVTSFPNVRVTGSQPPCTAGSTIDGSNSYTVGGLKPGTYNVFAKASTTLGDFVAGPASVTVPAGRGATKDFNVTYPRNVGALFGQAQVTSVPTNAHFEFLHAFVCNGPATFNRDGSAPAQTANRTTCVEGALGPTTVTTRGTTSTYAATYSVGPLQPNTQQLYIIYKTDFGVVVSPPQAVHPTGGHVGV